MRGNEPEQPVLFGCAYLESRVPRDHPLRTIKALVDSRRSRSSRRFRRDVLATGRPSIPPERLLKATLLMALYSVRSERQF